MWVFSQRPSELLKWKVEMKSTFIRFREQPTRVAVTGIVILVSALILPLVGTRLIGTPDLQFLNPVQITMMLCLNSWVLLAPLGLLLITCGMLGEYCRLRQHLDRRD